MGVILEHSVELLGTQNSSFKESHYTDIDRIQESLKMKLNRQTCQRIHENTTQFCSTHKYGSRTGQSTMPESARGVTEESWRGILENLGRMRGGSDEMKRRTFHKEESKP